MIYPDEPWRRITAFEYLTALHLTREIEAVKTRRGEDADYIIASPYRARIRLDDGPWRSLEVPEGFATDLSSSPAFARPVISRVGPHLEASIVHDWLYVAWQDIPDRGARPEDRLFADKVMLAGFVEARVARVQRWLMYNAVRLFGWPVYKT